MLRRNPEVRRDVPLGHVRFEARVATAETGVAFFGVEGEKLVLTVCLQQVEARRRAMQEVAPPGKIQHEGENALPRQHDESRVGRREHAGPSRLAQKQVGQRPREFARYREPAGTVFTRRTLERFTHDAPAHHGDAIGTLADTQERLTGDEFDDPKEPPRGGALLDRERAQDAKSRRPEGDVIFREGGADHHLRQILT